MRTGAHFLVGVVAILPTARIQPNSHRRHDNEPAGDGGNKGLATLERGANQHTAWAAPSQAEAAALFNVSVESIQPAGVQ